MICHICANFEPLYSMKYLCDLGSFLYEYVGTYPLTTYEISAHNSSWVTGYASFCPKVGGPYRKWHLVAIGGV
jgi:hypothetical protein